MPPLHLVPSKELVWERSQSALLPDGLQPQPTLSAASLPTRALQDAAEAAQEWARTATAEAARQRDAKLDATKMGGGEAASGGQRGYGVRTRNAVKDEYGDV